MFIDKSGENGENTVLEFGGIPTYMNKKAWRIVLTKDGNLYLVDINRLNRIINLYPTGYLDDIIKSTPDRIETLETGINVDNLLSYVVNTLNVNKFGIKGMITIPQSFGMSNGFDGSWDSIEILDEFRTKGHMLFALLLSTIPTAIIDHPERYEGYKDLNNTVLNGYTACSLLFINMLKLLYVECKNEKAKAYIRRLFPYRQNKPSFDEESFFNDGNKLLSEIIDIANYTKITKE